MGLAGLVQNVNLSPKGKEKPLKTFKQKGDNFVCCSERPLSLQEKGGKCEKTTEDILGGVQVEDASAWAGWWLGCGSSDGFVTWCLVTDWIWGWGRDGSGVSNLWMMRSCTGRGKARCRVGREGELGLDSDALEMPRHPSGDAEWAVGYLTLAFESLSSLELQGWELLAFRW